MSAVGVRELKNHLTAYLRRTKQGEEMVVTEHGKPIALLQPYPASKKGESLEARLAKLAAKGLVTLPTRKLRIGIKPIKMRGKPLSRMVLEDRR